MFLFSCIISINERGKDVQYNPPPLQKKNETVSYVYKLVLPLLGWITNFGDYVELLFPSIPN